LAEHKKDRFMKNDLIPLKTLETNRIFTFKWRNVYD